MTRASGAVAASASKERLAYRINEVAHLLGVSRRTINRRIEAGELESFKSGAIVLIPAASLARYMDPLGGVAPNGHTTTRRRR